jgi:hypothetical protein
MGGDHPCEKAVKVGVSGGQSNVRKNKGSKHRRPTDARVKKADRWTPTAKKSSLTPGLTNSKACPSVEETQLATHTCVVEEQR